MPKRKSDKKCKFDLFTDKICGLENIYELCKYTPGLITTEEDEDYLTDSTVLKNTKKLCLKDLLTLVHKMNCDPKLTYKTNNYRYQKILGKQSDQDCTKALNFMQDESSDYVSTS